MPVINSIAVVNQSKRITDDEARIMVACVNRQIYQDLDKAWDTGPVLMSLYPTLDEIPKDRTVGIIVITDKPDQADVLGWHSENRQGQAIGFVFISPVLDNGGVALQDPLNPQTPTCSSVLSHEALEMIGNPSINKWADGPEIDQGSCYSYEFCDPCEAQQYKIEIENVGTAMVSNFVWPAWFDSSTPNGEQVDQMNMCPGPFGLAPGGYFVVRYSPGTEEQVFGAGERRPWRNHVPNKDSRTGRMAPHLAV